MKFSVSSTMFCNRVQTLSHIIPNKSTIVALECILFELRGEQLTLIASDGENSLVTHIDVTEVEGEGIFAIKGINFANALKEISDQPIQITYNSENKELVIAYQNGKCSLVAESGEDYPQLHSIQGEVNELQIAAECFLSGISRTLNATSTDESRPVMTGIYVDINTDSTTFVSSDGHKLVRDRFVTPHTDTPSAFILPKKPAKILKEILAKESGDTIMQFDDKRAVVRLSDYTFNFRLIEGNYPNYNSVIPQDNPFHATIDRVALLSALRRVVIFANSSTCLVRLNFDHCDLKVSAQDIDYSTSAEERIICDFDGNTMNIGFKGIYLIDILSSMTSNEVTLQLADPSRAGIIVPTEPKEGEDLVMLIMPMMLSN